MKRLTWDQYFMNLCEAVSLRSIDENSKTGCVIVDDRNRIVSTGYNSFPAGVDDDFWPKNREDKIYMVGNKIFRFEDIPNGSKLSDYKEILKYDVMTHSELNAIASAKQSLVGYTLYCTYLPCHECAKMIITAGVKKVVHGGTKGLSNFWDKSFVIARELFEQAFVDIIEIRNENK